MYDYLKKSRGWMFSTLAALVIVFSLFLVSGQPAYALTDAQEKANLSALINAKNVVINAKDLDDPIADKEFKDLKDLKNVEDLQNQVSAFAGFYEEDGDYSPEELQDLVEYLDEFITYGDNYLQVTIDACQYAKTVLEAVLADTDATQDEINAAGVLAETTLNRTLLEQIVYLANNEEFFEEYILEYLEEYYSEDVAEELLDVLNDEIDIAEILIETPVNTTDSVLNDEINQDINDNVDHLFYILSTLYELCYELEEANYCVEDCSANVGAVLDDAITAAEAIIADPINEDTDTWYTEEAEAAIDELDRGIILAYNDWDIEWAQSLEEWGEDYYEADTWTLLDNALSASLALQVDCADADIEDINSIYDDLDYACYYADTEFWVKYIQYIDPANYDEDVWEYFYSEWETADAVLATEDPSYYELYYANWDLYDAYLYYIFVFEDVWPTDDYYDAVMYLYNQDLIPHYDAAYYDSCYYPEDDVTTEVAYYIAEDIKARISMNYKPTKDAKVLAYYPGNAYSASREACAYALCDLFIDEDFITTDTDVLNATFDDAADISATCAPALAYLLDEGLISDEEDNFRPDDPMTRGEYTILLYNLLNYYTGPKITTDPADTSVYIGERASLSLVATGAGQLTYQWYSNTEDSNEDGDAISKATKANYSFKTSVVGTTYYYCIVTDTVDGVAYTVTSDAVEVEVKPLVNAAAPTITGQPADSSVDLGKTATISVTATGSENGKLTYKWYSNTNDSNTGGKTVGNSNKASYSFRTKSVGTIYYYCVVTNTDKSVNGKKTATTTTETAAVEVRALTNAVAPSITDQPDALTIGVGESDSLSIEATGTGTLTYQWYSNSKNSVSGASKISGATSATYDVSGTKTGKKYYFCIVTNTDDTMTGKKTATTTSSIVSVTVVNAG